MIARIRSSELLRHSALVFTGVGVANVFNYLFFMLAGRVVGVSGYAAVTSLASAMLVVAAPANVVQLIVARLAADAAARADRPALRRLFDVATLASSGVALAVALVVYAARIEVAAFFQVDAAAVTVTGMSLAVYTILLIQRGVFQGAHRFGSFTLSMCVESVIKVAAGISLAYRFGAVGALAGMGIGIALGLVYNLVAARRAFGTRQGDLNVKRDVVRRVASHVGIGQLTMTVLNFYDVPLAKHVFPSHEAGLYAAAALVGRVVIGAVLFVPTLMMSKVTARAHAGHSTFPLLGAGVGAWAMIAGATALACVIAPTTVVTAMAGRSFAGASDLALTYVAAAASLALANVLMAYKIGLHRYDFVIPALTVALIEIGVLATWHPSGRAMVAALAVGHATVALTMMWRIGAQPAPSEISDDDQGEVELLTAASPPLDDGAHHLHNVSKDGAGAYPAHHADVP